jgi:hypothetical protein
VKPTYFARKTNDSIGVSLHIHQLDNFFDIRILFVSTGFGLLKGPILERSVLPNASNGIDGTTRAVNVPGFTQPSTWSRIWRVSFLILISKPMSFHWKIAVCFKRWEMDIRFGHVDCFAAELAVHLLRRNSLVVDF